MENTRFAICINNGGYDDDLKVRTVYQILPDESAARSNYIRIIDETGEDYLYPASCFVFINIPQEVGHIFAMPVIPDKITEKEKSETDRRLAA
jgi:hypothetical protein